MTTLETTTTEVTTPSTVTTTTNPSVNATTPKITTTSLSPSTTDPSGNVTTTKMTTPLTTPATATTLSSSTTTSSTTTSTITCPPIPTTTTPVTTTTPATKVCYKKNVKPRTIKSFKRIKGVSGEQECWELCLAQPECVYWGLKTRSSYGYYYRAERTCKLYKVVTKPRKNYTSGPRNCPPKTVTKPQPMTSTSSDPGHVTTTMPSIMTTLPTLVTYY